MTPYADVFTRSRSADTLADPSPRHLIAEDECVAAYPERACGIGVKQLRQRTGDDQMVKEAGDVAMLLANFNHLEPAEVAVELAILSSNADREPARLVVHDQAVDVGPVSLPPVVVDGIAVVVPLDAPRTDQAPAEVIHWATLHRAQPRPIISIRWSSGRCRLQTDGQADLWFSSAAQGRFEHVPPVPHRTEMADVGPDRQRGPWEKVGHTLEVLQLHRGVLRAMPQMHLRFNICE